MKQHDYQISLEWTGNKGSGTFDYRSYSRNHTILGTNKSIEILGSSDPSFRGDKDRYNPEELFLSSIASCHMLWYLHLCSVNDIIVLEYTDTPKGNLMEKEDGSGAFSEVVLLPTVTISPSSDVTIANQLHQQAHAMCFIANSCNFPIRHNPNIIVK